MFGLTVFKTYSTCRGTGSEARHLPIHTLILRDGASSMPFRRIIPNFPAAFFAGALYFA